MSRLVALWMLVGGIVFFLPMLVEGVGGIALAVLFGGPGALFLLCEMFDSDSKSKK